MLISALAVCLLSASAATAPQAPLELGFTSAPREVKRAQKKMGKWLRAAAKRDLSDKIQAIALQHSISLAPEMADLRDAVGEVPKSPGAGLPVSLPCASLEVCPSAPAMTRAARPSDVPGALEVLIQPWLLLQQRRGGRLTLAPSSGFSDAILTMTLEGLVAGPVDIHASLDSYDGLHLWLSTGVDLEETYSFSRDTLLRPGVPARDVAPARY